MTLKLVADNGEAIEIGGLGITAELRDLADRIDKGEYPDLIRIVAVIETSDTLNREIMGEVMTGFEIIGMMECVKQLTLVDPFGE
jgi:hypothetical protein